jgi:hypothetical protein
MTLALLVLQLHCGLKQSLTGDFKSWRLRIEWRLRTNSPMVGL